MGGYVLSDWYDLRENIQANDHGRIATANEQNRRANFLVYMPPPSATPAVNVANFNEAVTRATGANGYAGTIVFPPKKYTFDSALRVRNVLGLRVTGCGLQTHLEFNVTTGADWVTIEHSQHVRWEHMYMSGAGAGVARAAFALLRTNTPGSVYAPSQNHIHGLLVDCQNRAQNAVLIGGIDGNNDFHTFTECVMQNYTERGFDVRGVLQSYGNEMRNCRLYAGAGALYGLDMGDNVGGTFAWYGGIMVGHQAADFRLWRSYQPNVIGGGFHSEGSKRLIVAGGNHYKMLAIRDARWSGGLIHEDYRAIIWDGVGHLSVENCSIGDGGADTPTTLDIAAGNLRRTSFRNNRVFSTAEAVFPNGVPGDLFGNDQIVNEGLVVPIPLTA